MKASDLRPGLGVKMDGKLYFLMTVEHRTPGNLRAFVQIKIKDVLKGNSAERRLGPQDDIEVVDLDRRTVEYLYSDSSGATFMDIESYDQFVINKDVLGDSLLYLRPNAQTIALFHDGNPIMIELPPSVELTIKDCPPEVKGATVTNQTKDATLETGLVVKVPAFIKSGETIRISTSEAAYQSRA